MGNKLKRISRSQTTLETDAIYYIKLRSIKISNFRSQISLCSPNKQNRYGRIAHKGEPNKL